MHIGVVAEPKLTFLIGAPCQQVTIIAEYIASILDCEGLVSSYTSLLLRIYWVAVLQIYLSDFSRVFDCHFIDECWVFGALTVVVPAPTVGFPSCTNS